MTFDYEGKLTTGETFDSSIARGTPLTGGVGDFVPGFTEALKLMKPGDDWIVWIPPALGYGERGTGPIPPNSVLRFRMILQSVAPAAVAAPRNKYRAPAKAGAVAEYRLAQRSCLRRSTILPHQPGGAQGVLDHRADAAGARLGGGAGAGLGGRLERGDRGRDARPRAGRFA